LRPSIFGGPERVLAQLQAFRDAGVGVIDLAFAGIGHQRAMAVLDVLAEAVLPTMRQM
jgi:alkanesulfonate monooxygenase SsuD/methylene tetrahydromethanopterin reductase-like flavin-dependent oxidoreductase (luciferase family)